MQFPSGFHPNAMKCTLNLVVASALLASGMPSCLDYEKASTAENMISGRSPTSIFTAIWN